MSRNRLASYRCLSDHWLALYPDRGIYHRSDGKRSQFHRLIDGLAGMISLTAFGVYGIVAMTQGQVYLARFCFCVVGALGGFLWFNVKPAQLIMGDTGSGLGHISSCLSNDWPVDLASPHCHHPHQQRCSQ